MRMQSGRPAVVALAVAAATVTSCGSDTASGTGPLTVSDGWTAENAQVAAVYLTIGNEGGDDRLVQATSPAARGVGIMGDTGTGSHAATLDEVDVVLPTGETRFAPGERHIMLDGLTEPLHPGDTFPLTLGFEHHDPQTVTVEVVRWDEAVERYEAG